MLLDKIFKRKSKEPHCSAVIVAAGLALRMGTDKTMMDSGNMPVLARTLLAFESCAAVDEIVVVTRAEKVEEVAALCKKFGVTKVSKVICGGKTRTESALAGVSEVKKGAKLIAIHDGARPFATEELIIRVVNAASEHLSAVPVIRSTDTLKSVDEEGIVCGAIDRETTVRVQTPQVFDADLIKGALTKAVMDGLTLTDDCSAMELMGVKTYTVEGDEDNIKLTVPRDRDIAECIIRKRGDYYEDRTWL